jgi:hypothetical protein
MANTHDITIVKAIPPPDHRIILLQSRIVHWHVHAILATEQAPSPQHPFNFFFVASPWFHTNTPRYRPPSDVIFVPDIHSISCLLLPPPPPPNEPPPLTSPTPCSIGVPVVSYPCTHSRVGMCLRQLVRSRCIHVQSLTDAHCLRIPPLPRCVHVHRGQSR